MCATNPTSEEISTKTHGTRIQPSNDCFLFLGMALFLLLCVRLSNVLCPSFAAAAHAQVAGSLYNHTVLTHKHIHTHTLAHTHLHSLHTLLQDLY